MFEGALNSIEEIGGSVLNAVGEVLESAKDNQRVNSYRVEEIGKPFHFSPLTDPLDRTYRFLLTRMNVVDIYPVRS